MPKGTAYITALLGLIFDATTFTNVATYDGTVANIYTSLLTGTSGLPGGDQTTNEVDYTNYVRKDVSRSTGWTVTSDHVNPAAAITFAAGGSGTSPVASHFGLGTLVSGAGVLMYYGTVTPNITCGNGVTPQLSTSTSVTEA